MKKILLIIFFNIQLQAQEREILVEYEVHYNTASPRVKTSFLAIYNNTSSKFIELPNYKLLNEKNNENVDIVNINFSQKGTVKEVKIDFTENNLESIEKIFMNKLIFKVKENIPKIKWDINFTETKLIGKNKCAKAKTFFRGRSYTIWYSQEIPLGFGPWKLVGAPGLILEAYDETLTYRWIAKKIQKVDSQFENYSNMVTYDEEITLKKFIEKKYGNQTDIVNFNKKIKSKLPRGTKLVIEMNTNRQGKELIFEWEEETKEN